MRRRPNKEIIRALVSEAAPEVHGKGGWPSRMRKWRKLMLEAAAALEPWGKGGSPKDQLSLLERAE